jgi:signal transduction histidine kinase
MHIDWIAKLRHLLQVLAFCLAISAIQYAFTPERAYEVPLVYSLAIGLATWAFIDFGRHLLRSSADTGWPQGPAGMLLTVASIVGGFLLGTLGADSWFGWSTWESGYARAQLRNSILITVLAGIAGSYYFYNSGKRAYLERKMAEERLHANEARLKLLETQLEPHMLFNTLANLRALIGSDPARATDMLDRLIAYLRATLAASRQTTHSLSEEFERLRDYLELMAVRMGPRLRYTLELPPGLAGLAVPTLLLQPLVENSIQHGLEPKIEGGAVVVRASRQGNRLTLEVSDSGVGLPSNARLDAGFGLAQVRERLATAFGARASIELEAQPAGGTRAAVSYPCEP